MIPKNFPEGEARIEYFDKFFHSLQSNLFIFNRMKLKFAKRKKLIPYSLLVNKSYSELFDELQSLRSHEDKFLNKAYQVGFPRGKRTFTGIRGKKLSEYDQAVDYINLLFYFDETVHETISEQIKNKRKLGPFYRYINSLGE